MNIQDLIIKYAIGLPKRFTRKQKNAFINEIGKDFQALGYHVNGAVDKKKGTVAMNLMIGDVAHAKKIIITNYDTPQHNYGNPMKYYPFDGPATFASSFLPIYAPFIIGSVLLLYIITKHVPNINFQNNFSYSIIVAIIIALIVMVTFKMTKGVANKVNFNHNTSGVVAALKLAEELDEDQRKEVAFILTDNGCTNHAGDYMVRDALPKTIDDRLVIMLDSIGVGEEFVIGYKEDTGNEAKKLADCFDIKPKRKKCSPENLRYTSFSFYKRGLLIARGKMTHDNLIVENVSTNHDTVCDEKAVENCVKALKEFL